MSAVLKQDELQWTPMMVADIARVIEIENAIYEFPWTPGNFTDSLKAGYRCSILWQGTQVAAYAVVMIGAGEAHVLNLSVARALQRRGLGSAVLDMLMSEARASSAHDMLLEVRPSNLAGRAVYARAGFVQLGVRKDYYPAQKGREDALLLGRSLLAAPGAIAGQTAS